MDLNELDYTFDLLYQNITSNQAPGLNKVEKSSFLTQAQLQLVREYANPRYDQLGGGYDGNNKRQYDFSTITKHITLEEVTSPSSRFDQRAKVYTLPSDWFLTLNEQLTLTHTVGNTTSEELVTVKPISLSEYDRLMEKPFKYPNKGQAWRLITDYQQQTVTRYIKTKEEYTNSWSKFSGSITFTRLGEPLYIEVRVNTEVETITYDAANNIFYCNGSVQALDLLEYIDGYLRDNSVENNYESTITAAEGTIAEFGYNNTDLVLVINSHGTYYTPAETQEAAGIIELITTPINSTYSVEYRMRYVRKPAPIILENLAVYGEDISIDGQQLPSECELPEETHREIVERAVILAKQVWLLNTQQQQQNNQRERD